MAITTVEPGLPMTDDRWIFTQTETPSFSAFFYTYQRDQHDREGAWDKWPGRRILFNANSLQGKELTWRGGALAGAQGGHPLHLLFWGHWWDGPVGSARRTEVINHTQTLLNSSYFSALQQYGVCRAPLWGGSMTVYDPGPPGMESKKHTDSAMFDMIKALIDDGKLPAIDTSPRPLYAVLVPDTYKCTSIDYPVGWHTQYITGFLQSGSLWVALVKPDDPLWGTDHTMLTLTHELVEMMTDPEPSYSPGWRAGDDEAADAAEGSKAVRMVRETACLGGAWAEAYYSNFDRTTCTPIDDGYRAQLKAHVRETARIVAAEGTFRPDPHLSAGCSQTHPACCVEDQDYGWRVYSLSETARVTVDTEGFSDPGVSWSVAGIPLRPDPQIVTLEGDIPVKGVMVDGFSGRDPVSSPKDVSVHFVLRDGGFSVELSANAGGNFDVPVSCTVIEKAITGAVRETTRPKATAQLMLDFNGAELAYDNTYMDQITHCMQSIATSALERAEQLPSTKIRRGDPIDQISEVMASGLPAHVRPAELARIRAVELTARAASVLLERDAYQRYIGALVSIAPALALRVGKRSAAEPASD